MMLSTRTSTQPIESATASGAGWRILPVAIALLATTAMAAPEVYASQHMTRVTSGTDVSVEDVQTKISTAFSAIAEYSAGQRDEALAKARATMEMIDEEIEVLEQRARFNWAEMSEEARENTSEALRALRESRNDLSERYGALTQGTSSAWGDLKAGVTDAWEELKNAWNAAVEDSNAIASNSDAETMSNSDSDAK